MCYSAMVEQSYDSFIKRNRSRADYDYARHLFKKRIASPRLQLPRALEANFVDNPDTPDIAESIREYHADQIHARQQDLFKQKKRLADAQRKLAIKKTKVALNDQRIASEKIPWLTDKIRWHESTKLTGDDSRIYPQHFVSMVYTNADGERIVQPFRYHLRPAYADESFDRKRDGTYNARRNSLRKTWRNQFGKQHGLLLINCFYENVAPADYKADKLDADNKKKKSVVIQFQPDDGAVMVVPTIYDVWRPDTDDVLYSCALITDVPLSEVAEAGHDRTPISLTNAAADAWLDTAGNDKDTLYDVLDDVRRPYYQHALAA